MTRAGRRRWWIAAGVLVPVVVLALVFVPWPRDRPPATVADDLPAVPLFTIPYLDVASGSQAPQAPPVTIVIPRVSAHTDIPTRVLQAYVAAATVTAQRIPACHLTWATLAGVGRVESDHGQHGGDSINPAGEETTPVIGPALDGSPGVRRVPDTDHGALDGDPVWDHAVGPMQFLPSRWRALGERAGGDGRPADPQNIDDAALTAGRYLCASGDLSVPATWWAAMYRYNNSADYGRAVFSAAVAYAKAAS